MRALGLIPALAAMLVLIPAVPGLAPVQAVEILALPDCGGIDNIRLLEYGVGDDDPGDLNACQQKCRERLGAPGAPGVGAGHSYSDTDSEPQSFAQCIQACNEAFWKDFDKKFGGGSEKER